MIQHVIIAGGGIAGSAAALALRQTGIDVTVVERRDVDTDELGAFIRLNPNGLDALSAIDAYRAVADASFPLRHKERWSPDGELLARVPITDPDADRGFDARFITWTALQRALRDEAMRRGAFCRDGTRVIGVEYTASGLRVHLADGSNVDGDVLVGADGTHSLVRTIIDPMAPSPQYCGSRTIYGHTPAPPSGTPSARGMLRSYKGQSLFLAYTTAPSGQCYWFTNLKDADPLADPFPDTEEWRSHLIERLSDDASPVTSLVAEATYIRAADDFALPHLPRWQTDHMVVIGDAAHAAPPASEQGASLALEDAVVLGQCLRDLDVRQALSTFASKRRERVETIIGLATGRRTVATGPEYAYRHHIEWQDKVT